MFMDQSVFLAQLLGPILAIVGISLMLNEKHYLKMIENLKDQIMVLYIGWLIALFFGMYILLTVWNNGYVFEWILILFWVIAFLKWVTLVTFPKMTKKMTKQLTKLVPYLQYIGFFYMALGLFLCYASY